MEIFYTCDRKNTRSLCGQGRREDMEERRPMTSGLVADKLKCPSLFRTAQKKLTIKDLEV